MGRGGIVGISEEFSRKKAGDADVPVDLLQLSFTADE
jgi:hypothetical protein